ncbi:c-type cytochrome domain-containing protein, partial [Rhodopirellula bahusiensis]
MNGFPMTSPFDRRAQFFAICLGLLNSVALAKDAGTPASDKQLTVEHSKPVDFVRDIQPILRDNCYECHAGTTEEGNLNLGVKAKAFQGGDSDEAILVGNSEDSLMIDLVSGGKDNALMPPEGYEPLTAKQVGLLRAWIDQGAPWPEDADVVDPKMDRAKTHWAFQRLQKVNPPSRSLGDGWPKSP